MFVNIQKKKITKDIFIKMKNIKKCFLGCVNILVQYLDYNNQGLTADPIRE